ncbi:MAG: UDP-3-O-acyl-N-acetylglucosamine deacetylase [Alphaproteobacteria bacterium]
MSCNFLTASGFYPWQTTIKSTISTSGIGLHKGDLIEITLKPSKSNSGISFIRTDIEGDISERTILASYQNVSDTNMCTTIKNKSDCKISTIEHLMAALSGSGVDNIDIEIDGPEVPIMDGSSKQFIELIENAGLSKLSEKRKFLKITRNIEIVDGEKKCSLSPSNNMNFFASIDFSDKVIGKQEASINLENFNFKDNVSKARTFGFMRDVEALRMSGLGLGGSLDNCIIIDDNEVINSEGLRFENEFVVHKLLDAVGDIFTSGYRIQGEYRGYLCGHHMNNLLLKELFDNKDSFEVFEIDDAVSADNNKELLTA